MSTVCWHFKNIALACAAAFVINGISTLALHLTVHGWTCGHTFTDTCLQFSKVVVIALATSIAEWFALTRLGIEVKP
jgi:hypothetical protein